MDINLLPLYSNGRVDFDIKPDFKDYKNENIIRTEDIRVKGSIIDIGTLEYKLTFHISGYIIVKSAINNSEVSVPISIDYDEFVHNLVENYKKSANLLDILPIIWENIVLEIPIRATNKDDEFEISQGEGWEVIKEDN